MIVVVFLYYIQWFELADSYSFFVLTKKCIKLANSNINVPFLKKTSRGNLFSSVTCDSILFLHENCSGMHICNGCEKNIEKFKTYCPAKAKG